MHIFSISLPQEVDPWSRQREQNTCHATKAPYFTPCTAYYVSAQCSSSWSRIVNGRWETGCFCPHPWNGTWTPLPARTAAHWGIWQKTLLGFQDLKFCTRGAACNRSNEVCGITKPKIPNSSKKSKKSDLKRNTGKANFWRRDLTSISAEAKKCSVGAPSAPLSASLSAITQYWRVQCPLSTQRSVVASLVMYMLHMQGKMTNLLLISWNALQKTSK